MSEADKLAILRMKQAFIEGADLGSEDPLDYATRSYLEQVDATVELNEIIDALRGTIAELQRLAALMRDV